MPEPHARRRARLAAAVQDLGADAALISRLVNVHYLTGLDSSNAALLVDAAGSAVLATDSRYITAAADVAPDLETVQVRQVATELAKRAAAGGPIRLAVEEHDVTLALADSIKAAAANVELVHLHRAVERMRVRKDDAELALIRDACAISCRALEDLFAAGGLLGRRERDIARDLEARMYEHGADGLAFETIVAAGPNSAIPHHRAADRRVERGDLLKIDFGARVGGYHADCTRTVVVGAAPAAWQREIYEIVAAAQRAGRQAAQPGAECNSVDSAAREVIKAAGYGEYFGHGTGHGIGLEVHEAPTIGYSAAGTLDSRTPVTVEPGIYLPGRGGVRIEDTVVVSDDGGPERLTTTTRELLVLDM